MNNFSAHSLFFKISKVKKKHRPIKDDGLTNALFEPVSRKITK